MISEERSVAASSLQAETNGKTLIKIKLILQM